MLVTLPNTDVFMSSPGSVMMLSKVSKNMFYAAITGKGGGLSYMTNRCIVTGMTVGESTNHQFMNSLNSYVYLYTFGDRISELDVTGVAFLNGECDGNMGVLEAYLFFEANKVSKGETVSAAMTSVGSGGASTLTFSPCFLTNMTIALTDPISMLANFSFKLHFMPNV